MSDDLVKRVLKWVGSNHNQTEAIELMEAQAAEIARLRAILAAAKEGETHITKDQQAVFEDALTKSVKFIAAAKEGKP